MCAVLSNPRPAYKLPVIVSEWICRWRRPEKQREYHSVAISPTAIGGPSAAIWPDSSQLYCGSMWWGVVEMMREQFFSFSSDILSVVLIATANKRRTFVVCCYREKLKHFYGLLLLLFTLSSPHITIIINYSIQNEFNLQLSTLPMVLSTRREFLWKILRKIPLSISI